MGSEDGLHLDMKLPTELDMRFKKMMLMDMGRELTRRPDLPGRRRDPNHEQTAEGLRETSVESKRGNGGREPDSGVPGPVPSDDGR